MSELPMYSFTKLVIGAFAKHFRPRLVKGTQGIYVQTHKFIKSARKIIKPAKMNSWAMQVSSLLILPVWVMFVCCKDWPFTFSARDYFIGILRKGCFVIPWSVVSVYLQQQCIRNIKISETHIFITKDSSWGKWHLGSFYIQEGSSSFIMKEEVYLF